VSARTGIVGELTLCTMYRPTGKAIRAAKCNFSIRSYNLKEGRERTGHVGVRAPNETVCTSANRGQFMHRDLGRPPSRGNDTLGNKVFRRPRPTAQNRSIEPIPGLCNEYSSLAHRLSSLIRYEQPRRKTMVFSSLIDGRSSMPRIERGVTRQALRESASPVAIRMVDRPATNAPSSLHSQTSQ